MRRCLLPEPDKILMLDLWRNRLTNELFGHNSGHCCCVFHGVSVSYDRSFQLIHCSCFVFSINVFRRVPFMSLLVVGLIQVIIFVWDVWRIFLAVSTTEDVRTKRFASIFYRLCSTYFSSFLASRSRPNNSMLSKVISGYISLKYHVCCRIMSYSHCISMCVTVVWSHVITHCKTWRKWRERMRLDSG